MNRTIVKFKNQDCQLIFNQDFEALFDEYDSNKIILITDQNIFDAHQTRIKKYPHIIIPPGEEYKNQATINFIIDELLKLGADRQSMLVGVGGGVVTDITGYVASTYLRGLKVGFVPTTLLGMVDAAIGGKNGIDIGNIKNVLGTIRQPIFILHDYSFLKTLPNEEWINGFAEIIKHASIMDEAMFKDLEANSLSFYKKSKTELAALIERNAMLKINVVLKDEFENERRKLLNFGHTLGHAIENIYKLSHGQAISIGMVYAAKLSEKEHYFEETTRLENLLLKYQLPITYKWETEKVKETLTKDKKKINDSIHFILLDRIGRAYIKPIKISDLVF